MNNTYGISCEKCANNFFFNTTLSYCQKCDCDPNGVSSINALSSYCDQVKLNDSPTLKKKFNSILSDFFLLFLTSKIKKLFLKKLENKFKGNIFYTFNFNPK